MIQSTRSIGKTLLPVLFSILVCLVHHYRLSLSAYPSGWDAYFYLIQVKAMVEEGAMHSPDSSPIYFLLKWLSQLTGDYESGFQLLCASMAALFTLVMSGLVLRLTSNNWLAFATGLYCLGSPTLAFFAANFPKNLLGIDFFLLLLFFSLQKKVLGTGISLALSAISHRMTAGLGLLFLGMKALTIRRLFVLLLGGLVLFGASLLVPGLIHLSDLARFEDAFTGTLQIPHYSFVQLLDLSNNQPFWVAEITLGLVCWIGMIIDWILRSKATTGFPGWYRGLLFLTLILFFPFLSMDMTSIGYRFFLTGMLFTPLWVASLLEHRSLGINLVFGILLVFGSIWGMGHINTSQYDPDYARYERISQLSSDHFSGNPPDLIIAHKGLAEVITFKTGIDALPWLPEYEIDSDKLFRIATEVEGFEIEAILGRPLAPKGKGLGLGYLLISEADWQAFVEKVDTDGQDEELLERIHQWKNPMEIRPDYLLRNKENQ